jgi:hypothetical protein
MTERAAGEAAECKAMTEAANIERQKRRQAEFVNDGQQRLLEIEDMRLVVKFGDKKRYSDLEYEALPGTR